MRFFITLRRLAVAGLATAIMSACAKPSEPPVAPHIGASPASSPGSRAAEPLIDLRPFTITFGGQVIAKVFADGRTEAVGANPPGGAMSPGPTLHADGAIRFTKGGVTGRIARGGEIYVSKPSEELFGRIVGDHLAFGKTGVHADGAMLTFDDGRDDVGKIEGPIDAGIRRTALVMFAAFMIDMSITP